MRRLLVLATALITMLGLGTQVAAAGPPSHRTPDLVALGDSFAAGTGNTPYSDQACARSESAAYSELLVRLRLVALQAFEACKGATTATTIPQVAAITADTDIVTVQALGNDFYFSTLAAYCLGAVPDATCHRDQLLAPIGETVQQLLDSIPVDAPAKLDALYGAIKARQATVGSNARVIVVDYGNPFPAPGGRVGPFCPTMDTEELGVATDFANALNAALRQAAGKWGYTFADAAPRFRGLDICGFVPAFFRPPGAPGASTGDPIPGSLHPNRLGQGIYAAVLAGRLYS